MTGYQKLKATIDILYDSIGNLEKMLQNMKVPDALIYKERRERNARLYELDHEER